MKTRRKIEMTPIPDLVPSEVAFLQQIADDPADDTVRLVFADWLEECGHGRRAEFIRHQIDASLKYPKMYGSALWDYRTRGSINNPRTMDRMIHFGPWTMIWRDRRPTSPEPGSDSFAYMGWGGERYKNTHWWRGFPVMVDGMYVSEVISFAFSSANARCPTLTAPNEMSVMHGGGRDDAVHVYGLSGANGSITGLANGTYIITTVGGQIPTLLSRYGIPYYIASVVRYMGYNQFVVQSYNGVDVECISFNSVTETNRVLRRAVRMMLHLGGRLYRHAITIGYHSPGEYARYWFDVWLEANTRSRQTPEVIQKWQEEKKKWPWNLPNP